ncbi:hypothetical protein JR316_0008307 [Psilocybe cubensis]|uniref:Uncharacterized protein n=2 Tax=Psilocybe cubensis TaxID=181762 RepID=A0ACB8GWG6_PSICU|nr:hypothetical protein JR316_0008307 [Psilocybe cubensis]KAH9479712.1 hypothetical protein JR316_0008307 [Psilocybe cubensis]
MPFAEGFDSIWSLSQKPTSNNTEVVSLYLSTISMSGFGDPKGWIMSMSTSPVTLTLPYSTTALYDDDRGQGRPPIRPLEHSSSQPLSLEPLRPARDSASFRWHSSTPIPTPASSSGSISPVSSSRPNFLPSSQQLNGTGSKQPLRKASSKRLNGTGCSARPVIPRVIVASYNPNPWPINVGRSQRQTESFSPRRNADATPRPTAPATNDVYPSSPQFHMSAPQPPTTSSP